jgi:hypothetical protein
VFTTRGVVMVVMDSAAVKTSPPRSGTATRGGQDGLSPPLRRRPRHGRARRGRNTARLAIDNVLALHTHDSIVLLDGVFQSHDQQLTGGTVLAGVADQATTALRERISP